MHIRLRNVIACLGCCLIAPAAATIPPQSTAAPATTAPASAHSRQSGPKICFDSIYYAVLPGKTNYCLGVRDWNNGHYQSGLELLKLAAGWGNKNAQYTLGLIYYNGHHVASNRALGIAWLKLANQRGNDPQIELVTRSVTQWATAAQRKYAMQLYGQMLATYGDKVAAARAWHHMRHWQRSHSGNSGTVCLYGKQGWAVMHAGLAGMATGVSQAIDAAITATGKKPIPGMCVGIPLQVEHHLMDRAAGTYFQGWLGTVSVGPLKQVPASAASSGH